MSIWKTPDQKPDKNEPIIIRNWAGVLYSIPCMPFPTMREDRTWAYLREVVAQADKAERLLEIAERQNDILQDHFATLGYNIGKEVMDMCDEINN